MPSRPSSSPPPAQPDPDLEDWHPKTIGPYTVLSVLGEGGMGTVYLCEQLQPIRRQVAVKLIKLGQDTKEVLARFEQERQALSMMNHPCIAKVFDAGAGNDGRPYFVMEVAKGLRITHYCDDHELTLTERLELFQEVCDGIQHAHQKGIIHRDIKPSNILVTLVEGKAVPKIIDFGLALATEQKLTEQTLFTRQGQWIGTPEYMSPEQAGAGGDVDTRADIYSLGVMLYELLTGHLPFESWMLREAGLAEIQRTIQEEEPPKPSTKVSTVTAGQSENARQRRTDPLTLRKRLRGDLDWIVMRALEKEPGRRYASASEFAADIRRHLNHEPAVAGPPSWTYRTRKFLRRHRLQVTAAAAVLISLIAGIIVAFTQYRRAEEQSRIAKQEAKRAGNQSLAAQKSAAEAKRAAVAANEARERMLNQKQIALREARRSHEMLRKFKFLSYVTSLDKAKREAAQLYPAWPENKQALRDWIFKRRKLRGELGRIRSAVARIEVKANTIYKEAQAKFEGIEKSRAILQDWVESTFLDDVVDMLGQAQNEEAKSRLQLLQDVWLDGFLKDALVQLIDDIDAFSRNEMADVRQRFYWSRRVERLSITAHESAWNRVQAAVAAKDGPYRGLTIKPQMGLVPLGADPRSGLQEFVHLRSGKSPSLAIPGRDPRTGKLQLTADCGIVFVLIPGGSSSVGAQRNNPSGAGYDPDALETESPVADVQLAAFFLAKHEMTQAQWLRLSKSNPSVFRPGSGQASHQATLLHPVENISHYEASELMWQQGLTLPTEAQWEYVARLGNDARWPTGSNAASLAKQANLMDESARTTRTRSIASYASNGVGLHDLCGNVAEWCRDRFTRYTQPMRERDGLRDGDSRDAVVRGGSWRSLPLEARTSHRDRLQSDNRSDSIGLRPAREILSRS